jgi:hypothetical protein
MKANIFSLVVFCAIFVFVPNNSIAASDVNDAVVNLSLRGIKEIVPYVTMYWTGEKQKPDIGEAIEQGVAKKLTEAGIKVGSSEPNEAMLKGIEEKSQMPRSKARMRSIEMPELMIRIYAIKHEPTKSYVFNVQTSLARKVFTSQSIRSATKAEVWRIDTGPSAVDANNFERTLKDAAEKQVNKFIEEFKKTNNPSESIQRDSKIKEQSLQNIEEGYVSSKNSPVFHKADCPSVQRIAPENLVTYKNAEEAIQAGKRPCKKCNP